MSIPKSTKFASATDSAAATRYYPSANGWDMHHWSAAAIQASIQGGVTWTVEATLSPLNDPDAVWDDISILFVDQDTGTSGAASWVDDANINIMAVGLDYERLRIKEVTSDATNVVLGWIRLSDVDSLSGGAGAIPAGAATAALQTTLNGYEAHGTWTPATGAAAADSGVIRNAACTVRRVIATNAHTVARYLMLFDAAAVPADATAPRIPAILVPAETTISVALGGLVCANGLCWAMSSTQATKTITADTDTVCSAEII